MAMNVWSDGQVLSASPLNSNFVKSYKLLGSNLTGVSASNTTTYTLLSSVTIASGSISDSFTVGADVRINTACLTSVAEGATYAIRKYTQGTGEVDIVSDYYPGIAGSSGNVTFDGRTTVLFTTVAATADSTTVVTIRLYGKSSGVTRGIFAQVYNMWVYGG